MANMPQPSDEDLFKEPSERGECPICFLPRPLTCDQRAYFSCCGKIICAGCMLAAFKADARMLCPYCRGPRRISDREIVDRIKKRVALGDASAMLDLAGNYHQGICGLPQNYNKSNKLLYRAGELGCAEAYHNLAVAHCRGLGVERDEKKEKYYWELAAMGGNVSARYNLGHLEYSAGNVSRALKHWMIAARAGHDKALAAIRGRYMSGQATKGDFEKALRAHKHARDEMKSEQREEAAVVYSLYAAT